MLDLLLAACVLQQSTTAEARLEALETKLVLLDRRQKALETENAALEKRVADGRATREIWARQSAAAWIKRHAAAAFSEAQSARLEALWVVWLSGESATAETWKTREAELRVQLTPGQQAGVAQAVREDQEKSARGRIAAVFQSAKLPSERAPAFEKAVLTRLAASEGALIQRSGALQIHAALEESLADPAAGLTEPEQSALREALSRWKPR